ncbi:MAG: hypothetical protein ACE5JH_08185 [Acidobacteriota bacterium]
MSGRLVGVLAVGAALALAPALSSAGDDEGRTVVVSRPGVVFHAVGSDDVRGRGHERPMSEALAAGYVPCKVCFAKDLSLARDGSHITVAASSTTFGSSIGRGVVLGPGRESSLVLQPFGLKFPDRRRGHAAGIGEGVLNPYAGHETVRFPGLEQGAHGEP